MYFAVKQINAQVQTFGCIISWCSNTGLDERSELAQVCKKKPECYSVLSLFRNLENAEWNILGPFFSGTRFEWSNSRI